MRDPEKLALHLANSAKRAEAVGQLESEAIEKDRLSLVGTCADRGKGPVLDHEVGPRSGSKQSVDRTAAIDIFRAVPINDSVGQWTNFVIPLNSVVSPSGWQRSLSDWPSRQVGFPGRGAFVRRGARFLRVGMSGGTSLPAR